MSCDGVKSAFSGCGTPIAGPESCTTSPKKFRYVSRSMVTAFVRSALRTKTDADRISLDASFSAASYSGASRKSEATVEVWNDHRLRHVDREVVVVKRRKRR